MATRKAATLWDGKIVRGAMVDSFWKFSPRIQAHNPVMFVVEVTALAVTLILARDLIMGHRAVGGF